MSTNRPSVVNDGAAATKPYFCHQCEAIVTVIIPPSPSDEIACPTCGGEFLEEYEETHIPNSQIPRQDFSFSFSSSGPDVGLPFAFGDELPFNPAELTAALVGGLGGAAGGVGGRRGVEEDVFNPGTFLQNYLASMSARGADVQFVFENGGAGGGGGFGLPGNFGDYFVGPGLEQLIQQLAENDPNRHGTPPASKEAVKKLLDIEITEELMASDNAQCSVCMDVFELGGKAKKMPCKHIFHGDCILPWLELHNSCPVCRYELPTDDPEYEQRSAGGQSGNSAGESGESTEDSAQARRMRAQLHWPFNAIGFGSDGSNSGGNPNESGNSGGRSHQ